MATLNIRQTKERRKRARIKGEKEAWMVEREKRANNEQMRRVNEQKIEYEKRKE